MAETIHPVALVGAGPGDPDLLTLKALRLIREADVVVYDRLVSPPILALIPVGKIARNHHVPQAAINALLVGLARSGRKVVRLKGGDPFLFGRGGEEAECLAAHGIAFEIVPGVTSASGCTAYAGVPLTHRGLAHGVRFVTGHAKEDINLDWRALADPDTTLVLYMGRIHVERIADELIRHGLARATPAAIIVNGTRPDQLTLITTLDELPARVADLDMAAPTLIVIGRVVALAERLAWFNPERDVPSSSRAGGRSES